MKILLLQTVLIAQASLVDIQLKLGNALKIILAVGFIYGVVKIMQGAIEYGRDGGGKSAIISGVIFASAATIMYALYEIFLGPGIAPRI